MVNIWTDRGLRHSSFIHSFCMGVKQAIQLACYADLSVLILYNPPNDGGHRIYRRWEHGGLYICQN